MPISTAPRAGASVEGQAIAMERLVTIEGPAGRLALSDGGAGAGVPVLFVHGMAGSKEVWRGTLERLRATRRAAALDLRGHGDSDGARDGVWTIEALAADVDAAARSLGLERFVLVGHSMGGHLFFVDPVGDLSRQDEKEISAWAEKMANIGSAELGERFAVRLGGPKMKPDTRSLVAADAMRQKPEARALFRSMAIYQPQAALARFTGPKFTLDKPSNDTVSSLWKIAKGIERETIDTSHWPMLDEPALFNAALDRFLARM